MPEDDEDVCSETSVMQIAKRRTELIEAQHDKAGHLFITPTNLKSIKRENQFQGQKNIVAVSFFDAPDNV